MATRLYLARELRPPGQVVTPNGGWEKTTGALLARLEQRKSALFGSLSTTISGNGTSGNDTLLGQWISSPLDVNQNIGGGGATFRGQMRMNESSGSLDARVQCIVYVIQSDLTTVRGTLLAMDASGLSHEFNTSLRNISIPLGGSAATTTVNALAGDRIVVEIGFRQHATFSANGVMSTRDDAGTDLAVDETTTTANDPWVEFSDNITFATPEIIASQLVAEVVYQPTAKIRASQVVLEIVQSNTYAGLVGTATGSSSGVGTLTILGGSRFRAGII
jgi:hypothetical protein